MFRRLSLALSLCAAASAARAEAPLNVVVLDICSARADRFGAYGSKAGLTPELDAFSRQATVFENAWAQSSWCLPNYATLLTGHRPETHGLYQNLPFRGLADWEETVAERMRAAGYRTGGFTAGVYALPMWGLSRGFDTYVNRFSTAQALPGRFESLSPEIEAWIDRSTAAPFFLYATVDDLHAPYQAEGSTGSADGLGEEELSVRFFRAYNGEPLEAGSPLSPKLEAFRRDPRALPALARRYDAAVREVDRSLAKFFSALKSRGLWDRTVVVVTADHGELLGEHGLLGHTEGLYEPILRVPLLLRHPGLPSSRGARVKALVERIDIPATVLDEAGADDPSLELQGRSLRPLLVDPNAPWREVAYASSKRNRPELSDRLIDERAVRDGRWKLLWSLAKNRWELYDLRDDPGETRELSSARPDVVARLALAMQAEAERARPHSPGRPSGREEPARLPPPSDR